MTDIRIYQIDLDRDNDGVAFEPYGTLARYQGSPDVNPALYDKVFYGAVDVSDIEDIYRIFNVEMPEGYEGRSLSVSDVVEIGTELEDLQNAVGGYIEVVYPFDEPVGLVINA